MNEKLLELSVVELFEGDEYIIPLYQRNYAWEQAQVTQLIKDIWDSAEQNRDANYYIGSLIVHKREIDNTFVFETIDGQQRLTTLNILLSVLKNEFKVPITTKHEAKLKFDSRKVSSDTLKILSDRGQLKEKAHFNTKMEQAFLDMAKELNSLLHSEVLSLDDFTTYLFQNVIILRVEVPFDTDLNHYFEIMNNRGEQLEKHEILKAQLIKYLKDEPESAEAFAMIWDACSNMDRYVQFGFIKKLRDELFLDDLTWDKLPESFDEIVDAIINFSKDDTSSGSSMNFLKLMESNDIKVTQEEDLDDDPNLRFNSVINFPNFLLHVLRIHTETDIPLDDKRLIQTFKDILKKEPNELQFIKDFGYSLLKSRFLFDKYVIKREYSSKGETWSLQSIKLTFDKRSKTTKHYYSNTFPTEIDNKQAIMLLSMFHVSFPQIIYKHWLSGVLYYLFNQDETEIDIEDYVLFLEELSNSFYFDRFGKKELDYFDIIFKNFGLPKSKKVNEGLLHQGTNVQNFIFNRLDYLIWKSEVIGKEKRFNIKNIGDFEFSFRSSVEHYFPQHPKPGADLKGIRISVKVCNSFGNLCLISRSKNSELSNYSPVAKAEHYAESTTIESLKQQLMMRSKDRWDEEAILAHQKEMISLLNN